MTLPAFAAEVIEVAPVTVVGQRPPFPHQPQAVTVIDKAAIDSSGAANLADLLGREAFAVRRYGGSGAISTVMLRGSGTEGVLVLRDGVRLNDPQHGGVDLATVSLLGVERVEVLEGGSSGLFGSGAVGGVINLVTKARPGTRLEAGYGSWGRGHVQFDTAGADEQGEVAVAVRRDFADNDYPFFYRDKVETRRNARLDGTDVSVRLRRYAGQATVDGAVSYTNQAKGVPGSVNFRSPKSSQQDDVLIGSVRWSLTRPGGPAPTLSLSHRHSLTDYFDPEYQYGPPRTRNAVDSTDLRGKLSTQIASHDIEAGAGVLRDALDNTGFGFRQRYLGSIFARDTLEFLPGLALHGDGRVDGNEAVLGFSPRAGLAWTLQGRYRLRTAIGQSFRLPTFNDLYWPTSPFAAGNPDLKPATTRTAEVGWDMAPADWISVRTTAYQASGNDTIAWSQGSGGRWSPVNLGATDTHGVESRIALRPFSRVEIAGSHALLRAIDRTEAGAAAERMLPFRPDRVSSVSTRLGPWSGVTTAVAWVSTGPRFATEANTVILDPFDLLSADLEWAVTPADTVRLHGENVLNTYYVLQPDYPMPGRAYGFSWAHSF